jgi:hypothetical protein
MAFTATELEFRARDATPARSASQTRSPRDEHHGRSPRPKSRAGHGSHAGPRRARRVDEALDAALDALVAAGCRLAMAGLGVLVAAVQMNRWTHLAPHERLTTRPRPRANPQRLTPRSRRRAATQGTLFDRHTRVNFRPALTTARPLGGGSVDALRRRRGPQSSA